jgi:hypothetical protein
MIGVVRLLLAALYEIEAALRATAYLWLGTLNSPEEAISLLCQLDRRPWRLGLIAALG